MRLLSLFGSRLRIAIGVLPVFLINTRVCETVAQTWPKLYDSGIRDDAVEVIQTYDGGFALLGFSSGSYPDRDSWIIKTDANGNILWERNIYGNTPNQASGIAETPDGGLVVVGISNEANVKCDPFIVKFDACGDKEWCKIFPAPWGLASPDDVTVDSSGYILMLVNQYYMLPDRAVHIFKLRPDGNIVYTKPFVSNLNYPTDVVWGRQIIILQNGDYLITGTVYWENPWGPPGIVYIRGLLARIKPYGIEDWVLPISLTDTIYAGGRESVELSDGSLLMVGYKYTQSDPDPLFALVDSAGNLKKTKLIQSHQIDTLIEKGEFSEISFIDNRILVFGDFNYFGGQDSTIAAILDTNLFNTDSCILSRLGLNEQWTYSADMTSDGKPIFLGTLKSGNTWDMQFIKFNSNLSIASYDSNVYSYDSFCSYTPNSTGVVYIGTCDGVVGIEDNDSLDNEGYPSRLSVNPNPVSDLAQVSFLNNDHSLNYVLRCYNLFGALVYQESLAPGVTNHTIDVSNWNAGLYVLTISTKDERLAETKLVVVKQQTRTH